MSYKISGKDIIVSGFQNGIGDDPYTGISDIRNANISSVPGEVSANFSTSLQSFVSLSTVTISSANTGTDTLTITSSPTLVSGMAITIAGANLPVPLTTTSTFWVSKVSNVAIKLTTSYVNYVNSAFVDITTAGTPGNWTFSTVNVATPNFFTKDNSSNYWMVDSTGRVWTLQSGVDSTAWIYSGNQVPTGFTAGNGLGFYQASDGTGYIFVIHNGSIDYTPSTSGSIAWSYQWQPSLGTVLSFGATPTNVLKSGTGTQLSHEVIVTPNNEFIFVDKNWMDRFFELPGQVFNPADITTYSWNQTQLLPGTDIGQCLTFLGQNVLVGGILNRIYVWNQLKSTFDSVIFLSENNITKLVTINTNTYIFCGTRGRIYVTNGSNANVFKKIPDHISQTVEPYFVWKGATFQKNRLYFSFSVNDNSGNNLTSFYKGIWSIDVETKALLGTNQLSGTNAYANALIGIPPSATFPSAPSAVTGTGLYIGWVGTGATGIDGTISAPYSSGETYISTDLIPVGTYLKPFTPSQVEWKTSVAIGTGGTESISLYFTTSLLNNYTLIGTTSTNGSTVTGTTTGVTTGLYPTSDYYQTNFQKAQWVGLKAVLTANSSTSSTYVRLTELRIRDYPS